MAVKDSTNVGIPNPQHAELKGYLADNMQIVREIYGFHPHSKVKLAEMVSAMLAVQMQEFKKAAESKRLKKPA